MPKLSRTISYYCPKCDFSRIKKMEIGITEFQIGIQNQLKGNKETETEVELNLKAKGKK